MRVKVNEARASQELSFDPHSMGFREQAHTNPSHINNTFLLTTSSVL